MDSRVVVVVKRALDFELFLQIALKLLVDIVHHGLIAAGDTRLDVSCSPHWLLIDADTRSPLLFVHLVSKAHGVHHGEPQPHVTFLEVVGLSPQLHLRLKVG